MSFHRFVRRLHLYLGLFLLPWFFLYGVSSIPMSHPAPFRKAYADGAPEWKLRFERPYDVPVPSGGDDRAFGLRILRDAGLTGAYGTWRPKENEFHVYVYDFWNASQVKYFIDRKRLVVEDRRFRLDHILTGMHARGGFQQDSLLDDFWAVLVDGVSLGMILWIVSGIYMWWNLRQTRRWGLAAIGTGAALFLLFLAGL